MTGEWLAFCSACPVPEIANVFARAGIPFHQVTGVLDGDPECWREIEDWIAAAQVVETLSHLRLGLMGHYYGGMLDIATDLTAVSAVFGTHVEQLEIDELGAICGEMTSAEVADKAGRNTGRIRHPAGLSGGGTDPRCEDGGGAGRVGRTALAGRAGLLLQRNRLRDERGHNYFDHSGHFHADGARRSGCGRVRGEKRARDEDYGLAGRGRFVYRVLRGGLQRRRRVDGPRWTGPSRYRRGQGQGEAVAGLSTARLAAGSRWR